MPTSIKPGLTALTLTLKGAKREAHDLVKTVCHTANIEHHGLHILPSSHFHHLNGLCSLAEEDSGPGGSQIVETN